MVFTTDTILKELYAKLKNQSEDGAVAAEDNIRIDYIYRPLPAHLRKDFRDFMNQDKHNPLKLPSGQKIDLAGCFVNPCQDDNHRWGFHVIVDDCGFEDCAELFDYLLTAEY
ncbi:hypothetical protein ABBQ38_001236 [Trebouxia sp. C0009 RCD-2024]